MPCWLEVDLEGVENPWDRSWIEVGLDALVGRGGFTWRSWMSPAYVVESILPLAHIGLN